MDLKYLSVKEEVQNQRVSIVHIGTDHMIADPLTKGLLSKIFIGHVERMGITAKSLQNGFNYRHIYVLMFASTLLFWMTL